MIMMSRVEMEMRIRQQELLREREQTAESTKVNVIRASGPPPVHSQFFARRFGGFIRQLKFQPA